MSASLLVPRRSSTNLSLCALPVSLCRSFVSRHCMMSMCMNESQRAKEPNSLKATIISHYARCLHIFAHIWYARIAYVYTQPYISMCVCVEWYMRVKHSGLLARAIGYIIILSTYTCVSHTHTQHTTLCCVLLPLQMRKKEDFFWLYIRV